MKLLMYHLLVEFELPHTEIFVELIKSKTPYAVLSIVCFKVAGSSYSL